MAPEDRPSSMASGDDEEEEDAGAEAAMLPSAAAAAAAADCLEEDSGDAHWEWSAEDDGVSSGRGIA